ncbi:MAG: membrane dipeptidase, partial [Flavobacteriaceae bacterium]
MKKFVPILSIMALLSCGEKKENDPKMTLEERAQKIHERVITIDTHCDINVANFTDSINYGQRLETQVDLPKMNEGGLDVAWLIVYTGQDTLSAEGYAKAKENAMAKFTAIHRLCNEFAPDQIGLATTSEEVRKISGEGKKVAMIGVENAYPIGEDLSAFKEYYDMGARYISLSHNGH